MQILTFTLDDIDFGIPMNSVDFISERTGVLEIPGTLEHVKGIVTLRGIIMPVYSLGSRFGYIDQDIKNLVVINMAGMTLGIEVGKVNEIINIEKDKIMDMENDVIIPLPEVLESEKQCIQNVLVRRKQMILLIDINRLLTAVEKRELHQLVEDSAKDELVVSS